MEAFDIRVCGIDLSPKTYTVLAEDSKQALEIAQRFNKATQNYADYCYVTDVTHNANITTPEEFEAEMKDLKEQQEALTEIEKEEASKQ